MRNIHPVYILVVSVLLVIFSQYKINQAITSLQESSYNYQQTKALAKELYSIKKAYGIEKKKSLELFLSGRKFSKAGVILHKKKDQLKVEANSLKIDLLQQILSKVLNQNYHITMLDIQHIKEDRFAFSMELSW